MEYEYTHRITIKDIPNWKLNSEVLKMVAEISETYGCHYEYDAKNSSIRLSRVKPTRIEDVMARVLSTGLGADIEREGGPEVDLFVSIQSGTLSDQSRKQIYQFASVLDAVSHDLMARRIPLNLTFTNHSDKWIRARHIQSPYELTFRQRKDAHFSVFAGEDKIIKRLHPGFAENVLRWTADTYKGKSLAKESLVEVIETIGLKDLEDTAAESNYIVCRATALEEVLVNLLKLKSDDVCIPIGGADGWFGKLILGNVAASQFQKLVDEGYSHFGMPGGKTIYAMLKALAKSSTRPLKSTLYPVGFTPDRAERRRPSQMVRFASQKLGATVDAYIPNKNLSPVRILKIQKENLDFAFIGASNTEVGSGMDMFQRMGLPIEALKEEGVIGETIFRTYDENGDDIRHPISKSISALELADLRKMVESGKKVYILADNPLKSRAVISLVKGRVANGLIITRDLAERILIEHVEKQLKEIEQYENPGNSKKALSLLKEMCQNLDTVADSPFAELNRELIEIRNSVKNRLNRLEKVG
jgi:DNA-binding transcriptional regulator LsrR (DeoR family)